jgi:UDP-2-acetamido-3-amino-2,3-dideoxy-glucuronate N-acetyltransferase
MAPFIHPTALVEPGANIGSGTYIWHHAHVRANASIGENCVLGKGVFIDENVAIGSGVKVQNNVSIYRGVSISDDVFIGPSAVFTNDLRPRAFNENWQVVPTRVLRGASIGANATIVCGIEIGEYAMVAAGSVVTRSVAAHRLVIGNPARPHGWVCRLGETVSTAEEPPGDFECTRCNGGNA